MTIQSMQLDPNAASYSDDEIVSKVNAATAKVDADRVEDGSTNKVYTGTEQTKLGSVAEGAEVNPDGDGVVALINSGSDPITREDALSQDDLKIIKTNPVSGEFQIKNIHRDAAGKMDIEYEDTPET